MSPLPAPAPLRRTFLRVMFSPVGLLCGFVVLLMTTCPGARGDDGIRLLATSDSFASASGVGSASLALTGLHTQPATQPSVVSRASSPRLLGRSLTPAERGEQDKSAAASPSFSHSRSAVPLLASPTVADANRSALPRTVPMTGPAVGIRPKLPQAMR